MLLFPSSVFYRSLVLAEEVCLHCVSAPLSIKHRPTHSASLIFVQNISIIVIRHQHSLSESDSVFVQLLTLQFTSLRTWCQSVMTFCVFTHTDGDNDGKSFIYMTQFRQNNSSVIWLLLCSFTETLHTIITSKRTSAELNESSVGHCEKQKCFPGERNCFCLWN